MTEKDKREAVAERQRRYRDRKNSAGFTRIQLYVPNSCVDTITNIAERLAEKPSLRFAEIPEPTKVDTYPLPLTHKKTGRPIVPKYRNPQNPAQVWSGMGRQPEWVWKFLKLGVELKDLEIGD